MGDFAAAVTDATAAVSAEPNSHESLAMLCRARFFAGEFDAAAQSCATVLKMSPTNYTGQFYSGRLSIQAKNWTAANAAFTALLTQENNNDAGAHYWRSLALFHLNQDSQALDDVNGYLETYPNDPDAFLLRARIESKMNNMAFAKIDATAALKRYQVAGNEVGANNAKKLLETMSAPR